MTDKLEGDARARALAGLKGWREVEGRDAIARSFAFADFMTAFAFMGKVAVYADVVDHHPEWSNVYNKVAVTLTSHDVDGISPRDIAMARFMDKAAAGLQKAPAA
jgi:4a-hydroxytetrahydrobiopterin dehydratase